MNSSKLSIKIDSELMAWIAAGLFFSEYGWYALLHLSRTRITILLSVIIPFFFLIVSIILDKKKTNRFLPFLMLIVCSLAVFGITGIFHPEYSEWFNHEEYGILNNVFYPTSGIYAFLFIMMIDKPENIKKALRLAAFILFVYGIYQISQLGATGGFASVSRMGIRSYDAQYSLSFGYRTVLCCIVFLDDYLENKKIPYLLLTVISAILVLIYGGRGCFVVFLIFVVFIVLEKNKGMSPHQRIAFIIGSLIVLSLVYLFQESILTFLSLKFGSSSRTVMMLSGGEGFSDNGRMQIWNMAIELIKNGGIFGHGAYGDRYYIGRYYYWGYSHNVFLELLVSFGIFGLLASIILILSIFRSLKISNDSISRRNILIITALSCQLLVSDSFWYNTWFWALVALVYATLRNGKSHGIVV